MAVRTGSHLHRRGDLALGARLPRGWQFSLLFLAFPVWWILGLSPFILPILAAPMGLWLLRLPRVLAPPGFGLWLGFLLWMAGSAIMIEDADKYIRFGYMASLYVGATILLLFVFNISEDALPTAKVIRTLAIFWMLVVGWGILGFVFPRFEFTSPVEVLLPQRLAGNEFVNELVHPALAQVHDFLGYESPRPKAPFTYATNWGAAYAFLAPFVILSWRGATSKSWRRLTAGVFLASMLPVIASLDRGLWLSLGVGLVYAAVRSAMAGRTRLLRIVVLLLAGVFIVIYLSPLKVLVTDRFANPHSNEGRLNLYGEAIDRIPESPLLGFGSPQPSTVNPNLPPVGTQGQFWQILVSHGVPATALFVGWFLVQFWRLRSINNEVGFWTHTLILIMLIQLPFYDSLGIPLAIVMAAIGLAQRERMNPGPPLDTGLARRGAVSRPAGTWGDGVPGRAGPP